MRLYGQKILKRGFASAQNRTIESMDAVLWSIDPVKRLCQVRIQGSSQNITATYPKNWRKLPAWMKIGVAVRVAFRRGVRGYVEVLSEGRAIPSPVGGGESTPDPGLPPDMILSGLIITPFAGMIVNLSNGSYRINGVVYFYYGEDGEIILGTDEEEMGYLGDASALPMGASTTSLVLDDSPAVGYFRYDGYVIGEDGVIDYLKGVASTSSPVKPLIPPHHLLVGEYILVIGGATEITITDIGRLWEAPYPSYLDVVYNPADQILTDIPLISSGSASVTLKSQYGQTISAGPANGIKVDFMAGSGTASFLGETDLVKGDSVDSVWSSSFSLNWYRDLVQVGEEYPVFQVQAEVQGLGTTLFFLVKWIA